MSDFWFGIMLATPFVALVVAIIWVAWHDWQNDKPDTFGRLPAQRPAPIRLRNQHRG